MSRNTLRRQTQILNVGGGHGIGGRGGAGGGGGGVRYLNSILWPTVGSS